MNLSHIIDSKSLSRAGTNSKTIYYSNSKSNNRFEFQNQDRLKIFNPSIELRGTLNRASTNNKNNSNEIERFRKIKIIDMPNTIRTINPSYNTEFENKKPLLRNKTNPNFVKTNIFVSEGTTNNPIIPKFQRKENISDIFNIQNNENLDYKSKKILHYNEFHKYTDTTQIFHLPGGKKRCEIEIKDDGKLNFNKSNNNNFKIKVNKDYKSNVSCLFPSNYSQRQENTSINKKKNIKNLNQTVNIFYSEENLVKKSDIKDKELNKKYSENSCKNFNFFNNNSSIINKENIKINSSIKNSFINAHQSSIKEKDLIPHPKQKIIGARNPFLSQIKIN